MTSIGPTDCSTLVTGGAGFIGSHLADALVDDNDVRVLDDLSSGSRSAIPDAAEHVEGDIRDVAAVDAACSDVDIVFHHAADISDERSIAAPIETHAANADGTLNVLEAVLHAAAPVPFGPSDAVYGAPAPAPVPD